MLGDDELDVMNDILKGDSELYRITKPESGFLVCHLITRVEKRAKGFELVVVAAIGHSMDVWLPILRKHATAKGCKTARIHTRRLGLGRKLEKENFYLDSQVYRVEL